MSSNHKYQPVTSPSQDDEFGLPPNQGIHAVEVAPGTGLTTGSTGATAPRTEPPPATGISALCGCCTLGFYRPMFDLSTADFRARVGAVFTVSQQFPADATDLYGPLWIGVTLAFSIGAMSNFVGWLSSSSGQPWAVDVALLSTAMSVTLGFILGCALVTWAALRYWGVPVVSLFHLTTLCGYAMAPYIPATLVGGLLASSMITSLLIVLTAGSIAAAFVFRNIQPVVQNALTSRFDAGAPQPRAWSRALGGALAIAQLGFALALKFLFFAVIAGDTEL